MNTGCIYYLKVAYHCMTYVHATYDRVTLVHSRTWVNISVRCFRCIYCFILALGNLVLYG